MATSRYKKTFIIRPLEHMYDLSAAPANQELSFAAFPSMNLMLFQQSITKRPGYSTDRTMSSIDVPQVIAFYKTRTNLQFNLILTTKDLIKRGTTGGQTYTYLTPTYTTGSIVSLDETKKIVTGNLTDWINDTGRPAAGDYFALDADLSPDVEPNAVWTKIASVDSDTQITLETAYPGTSTSGIYRIRKIYSVPSNERWSYAIVGDKFCFTNGDVNVQYWSGGAPTAADLDPVNAVRARYCIEYANRLLIADCYINSTRQPWTLKWSKEGDPTDWTDSTAGENDFIGTESYIMGLGKVANLVLIYKRNSIIFGTRKGIATDPFSFPTERMGVGLLAPYSLTHALGTNFFLGNDDFYMINGDYPESIGKKIRDKFFSMVSPTEQERVWGGWSEQYKLIMWFAITADYGQLAFVYDYKNREWMTFKFYDTITGFGEME